MPSPDDPFPGGRPPLAAGAPSTGHLLAGRFRTALATAFGPDYAGWDPEVRPATRPEFGDFQTNLPLRLAKPTGLPPREAAARLLAALDLDGVAAPPEVAGAGFVNVTLDRDYLRGCVAAMLADERLGVPLADPARRVVVDYSSPNVAKQMHVGHLRSTVIGDAIARVLACTGHDVVRRNHVGDWGTQFGMLIEQLEDEPPAEHLDLAALDALYRRARSRFEPDAGFADRARQRVVALQSGDPRTVAVWRRLVDVSLDEFDAIYRRLGVLLTRDDVAGESRYNDALPGVVEDLAAAGLLTESDGARCAFVPGFARRDGAPLPVIVQKADGGFGYDATDLAAIRHRVGELGAEILVYVVDARQALHFDQVFALARLAGWLPGGVEARHVAFGTVLGEDGRPFRTRAGDTVPLSALLDAAVARAAALLDERGSELAEPERSAVAQAVGIGAVKYADLSNDRRSDYQFSLDRMVALTGNTAPYLQYGHARVAGILGKAGSGPGVAAAPVEPAERRLAVALTGFGAAVSDVAATLEPHRLCGYLYDLTTAFSAFYENCPVLRAEPAVQPGRLALCELTRRVLASGAGLLGITLPPRM